MGILCGIFTGLVPGIHPNTVIFTLFPLYLSFQVPLSVFGVFLASLSVVHTFLDFLPAIFVSAPDADAALTSVFSSETVEKGRGLEVYMKTVYGGALGVVFALALGLLSFVFLKPLYGFLTGIMPFVLLFFIFFLVLDSGGLSSLPLAFLCGVFGVVSLNSGVNQSFVFIPIFSGLFAVPAVWSVLSSGRGIPEQRSSDVSFSECLGGGLLGTASGFVAGVIPGVGGAVSASFLAPLADLDRDGFATALGAVNTTDILFSLVSLHLLGASRSGPAVALEMAGTGPDLLVIFVASVLAAAVTVPVTSLVARQYLILLRSVPVESLLSGVLVFLVGAVAIFTGFQGLLILVAGSALGYVSLIEGDRRVCMMVLLVPALISYSFPGAL